MPAEVCQCLIESSLTVFPAAHVLNDALRILSKNYTGIVPVTHTRHQGLCSSAFRSDLSQSDFSKIKSSIDKIWSSSPELVVVGAGFVQIRKGIDIFLSIAALVPPHLNIKFVWVGAGYEPTDGIDYCVWLRDYIYRSGLSDRIQFISELPNINPILEKADVFLLSSRLDPFPNVLIEACCSGTYSIVFDDTTGFADFLRSNPEAGCVVKYGDLQACADTIMLRFQMAQRTKGSSEKSKKSETYRQVFSSTDYVDYLQDLIETSTALNNELIRCASYISNHPSLDLALLQNADHDDLTMVQRIFDSSKNSILKSCTPTQIYHSLRAGKLLEANIPIYASHSCSEFFDDTNYPSSIRALWESLKPFRDHLYVGEISKKTLQQTSRSLRILLHLHCFYLDKLPLLLSQLEAIKSHFHEILITVPFGGSAAVRDMISKSSISADIRELENRGRNVFPWIKIAIEKHDSCDLMLHFHLKGSPHLPTHISDAWADFLRDTAFAMFDHIYLDEIVNCFETYPQLGLLYPIDSTALHSSIIPLEYSYVLASLGVTKDVATQFGHRYPVGFTFWARIGPVPLFAESDLAALDEALPDEPIPNDGTVIHGVEHFLPVILKSRGLKTMSYSLPGVYRE
jgi:hypothetical protein